MTLSWTCIPTSSRYQPQTPEMTSAPPSTDNRAIRKSWTSSLAASPQVYSEWPPPRRRSLCHPAPRNAGPPMTDHAIPGRAECFAWSTVTPHIFCLVTGSCIRVKDSSMKNYIHAERTENFSRAFMIWSTLAGLFEYTEGTFYRNVVTCVAH